MYSNCCEQVSIEELGTKDWIKCASFVIFGVGKKRFLMGLWEFETQIFGEEFFIFTVDLVERNVEGWHYSVFIVGSLELIVFSVIEFKEDYVIDVRNTIEPEVIHFIEVRSIGLQFIVFDFRRDKVDVVATEVSICSYLIMVYTSFMLASSSGRYCDEINSLGGSFFSIGRSASYSFSSLV